MNEIPVNVLTALLRLEYCRS